MLYATNRMQSGSNHLKLRRLKCKEKKKEYNCTLASSTSIDHFQAVAKITDRDGYRFYERRTNGTAPPANERPYTRYDDTRQEKNKSLD